jgi:acyl-CoA dehydrogenase
VLQGLIFIALISAFLVLIAKQASIAIWTLSYAFFMLLVFKYGEPGILLQATLTLILFVFCVSAIKPLRQTLLTRHLFQRVRKAMPVMSATEREALEAGTVSWEGDLFSGSPNFDLLTNAPVVKLTEEEQAFLDGPTTALCHMLDDWDITHNRTDLPEDVWQFIKDKGFLGMIIPKQYGGLEFSATAQMSVLVKLYGHSITAATTVSVPNSLGPAELLLKYGTEEQKNYYLPRLANGREIPCFALTGPNAGSDAASIPDTGVVCRQTVNGETVLGLRLTWNKRYITLCPVATVIGLAFRLFDPENLLGKGFDVGISCALIPASTPGVIKGQRHFPLNTAFMNGPTQGRDVFVPIDCLIGGAAMAGHGWRMLMECLSAGRAIGLPASASGGAQAAALASGAYARVRKQFNQPIAKFEGIEEPLARIAGNTYIIDAALMMTAAAIDHGAKPAVAGAILKYHTTERSRKIAMDAMDIHGGKGICLGPNNYLARGYQGCPISITVEGANILSRSLIIFGQGAIRCHPYVFQEMEGIRNNDLTTFDTAIWGHFGFILSNLTKSMLFAFTDARWTKAPSEYTKRYYQLIHQYSSNLAFLADFSMVALGGALKRKEKLSARLGDILSYLYLASAVLKRFHHDGEPASDRSLVDWCCQQLFHDCELAIQGIIANFPIKWARIVLKMVLQPFGHKRSKPSDKLGHKLAALLTEPTEARARLTRLTFHDATKNCPLGRLEAAFYKICAVEELERKVQRGVKEGLFQSLTLLDQIEEALTQKILSVEEATQLREAELARQDVIAVDDFSTSQLARVSTEEHPSKKMEDDLSVELSRL